MVRKLEVIIKEGIDIPAIAKAIRAEGYRTKIESKGKKVTALAGSFLDKLRSPQRFQKLKDGWVRDNLLGLDWAPSSTNRMNWQDAKTYAVDQGGRLPEIDELAILADRSKRNPAINPIFTDTKTDDYYWSNTPVAGYPDGAWYVNFGIGCVDSWYKDYSNYVRPVRSSQ